VASLISPRTAVLDNGLRAVAVELPHLHTATLVLYVKVGSRFEAPADNGLSHFVEHMLFRGTARHGNSYELNFAIERLGGTLYAETGRDYSLFQVALHPAELDAGLELFGDIFGRPRFADLELERRLILEELNEDFDERGVEINGDDIVRGLIFGDHPLGQRIIGPHGNVERFAAGDIERHFESFYCARNMLLCVAGPVKAEQVFERAAAHLGGLHGGAEATPAPAAFAEGGPLFRYVPDSGSQSSLHLLIRAVPEVDAAFTALLALLRALDDGMATRLHYRLADQLGLAYSVQAGIEPLHDTALLEIVAASAHANAAELVRRTLDILAELRETEVSAAELDKVKRRYRYELASSIDDANAMAGWFGGTALYYAPPSFEEKVARMEAITAADIRAVANRVLTPDNLAVVLLGSLSRARQAEIRDLLAF
jgi:predicted Zn-dependent peptidase